MFLFSRLVSKSPQLLGTFIIFSLSAGVLGGIVFYIDNTTPGVLGSFTEGTAFDMQVSIASSFYSQNDTSLYEIRSAINSEALVNEMELISFINTHYYEPDQDWLYEDRTYLGADKSLFEKFPNAVELQSNITSLNEDTCLIERKTMERLSLQVGDAYTAYVSYHSQESGFNEYNHSYEIVGVFDSNVFLRRYHWWGESPEVVSRLHMITSREGLELGFPELPVGGYSGIEEAYWLDIADSQLLDQDPSSLIENLDNMRKRIEQAALPYAYVESYEILDASYKYVAWAIAMRAIAIAFSIPSIVMGVMLVYYTSNLMGDERRRDVGTLKTRGGSGWQAFRWIISSSLLTAIIGSIGAVVTGALAAYLSSAVKLFLVFDFSQLEGLNFLLNTQSILWVFVFSFGVGMLVSLPVAIRSYLMTATEAHSTIERDILLEKEEMGSVWVDLVGLAISGYVSLQIILSSVALRYYGVAVLGTLVVLAPFFAVFIITFSRLFSRPVASIKSKILKRINLDILQTGTRVMSKTVSLFKKSEAMGVIFIAMVFAAGVFSSVSADTGQNHMEDIFKFQVGSDVTLDVQPGLRNITTSFLQNISAVEGVSHVSATYTTTGAVSYYSADRSGFRHWYNESVTVYAVQPDRWYDSAFWLDYFTQTLDPKEAISLLAENHTNVMASFKPVDHYNGYTPVYSDQIKVRLAGDGYYNSSDCTIVDMMSDGGVYSSNTYLPGEPNIGRFVVMNMAYVHFSLRTSEVNRFLIDLEDPAEYEEVMQRLFQLAPNSFSSIESPYTEIDAAIDSPAGQSIHGIYTMNVFFTLIFLSAGMFIVSLMRTEKLSKQFSILRALGAEKRAITASVLIDTSLSLFTAALIGGSLGVILSGFIINMPIVYFGEQTTILWTRLPVRFTVPELILGTIIVLSCVFSLIATYLVVRRNLQKNIAEDIQYME